uniref:GG22416 n=1 Tax=Drosophila erecta TaxID=7220 RepID=B3P0H9_DROER
MSAPQQPPGDSRGGAPPPAGRDSANQPAWSSTAGGSGHSGTGSRGLSPSGCGHFNNRVWSNHNQRQTLYPQSNYGNRDHSDSRSSIQERQERDYTKRTDFRERNTRYSDERHSGRYSDYPRRKHYYRTKPRGSEGRSYHRDEGARDSSRSPNHNGESGSSLSRATSDIRRGNGHNCDQKSDACKPHKEYNQSCVNHYQAEENKIDLGQTEDKGASRTSPTEHSSDISQQPDPIASEGDQHTKTNGLKDSSCPSKQSKDLNETSKAPQFSDRRSEAQSSEEKLKASKFGGNPSGVQASQSIPRIQVRPLTELLRQELFAVTQENLCKRPLLSPPPSASPASPSRLAIRPNLRNRRRTVSNCIYNAASLDQAAESEAVFNDRIASMDKETLKYIINNGDTIFEPHLQLQARRRIRDEIRRQLKTIELDKPKDCLVQESVEDEIVDAIKLPAILLEEIEKCFGIDISEGQTAKDTEVNKKGTKKETEESKGTCNSAESSKDFKAKKTKATLHDNDQSLKFRKLQNKIDSNDNNQQVEAGEPRNPHCVLPKGSEDSSVKSNVVPKKVLQENNKKKSRNRSVDQTIKVNGTRPKSPRQEEPIETVQHLDSIKRSEIHQSKNRAPLLPTPTCERVVWTNSKSKHSTPSQSALSKSNTSNDQEIASVDCHSIISTHNKMEIKRESSSSPISVSPLASKEVIDLLSSSDGEQEEQGVQHMDVDELEGDSLNQPEGLTQSEPATVENADSDNSTSSQSSSKSTKRRRRLKLRNDAENVVDSFEKLILPHLREALTERYRRQHSSSLQSRLHFISCVVTSSEHNSQTFSKIEVAKMQMNLKAVDNRQAIEFLLKEIVNVVSLQKQRRREQDEEQKLANLLSPKKSASMVEETPKASTLRPIQQCSIPPTAQDSSPDISPGQKPPSSPAPKSTPPIRHSSPVVLPFQKQPSSPVRESSPPTPQSPISATAQKSSPMVSALQKSQSPPTRQSSTPIQENPMESEQGSARQKTRQKIPVVDVSESPDPNPGNPSSSAKLEHFPVGFPFLAMDPALCNYTRLACGSKINEPLEHLGDMMAQNLVEIDRRLMENQNRRSILDDMISKFQKEKSELEMVNLELQSRRFLMINSMISRNQATSAQAANSKSKPPPAETTQESRQDDSFSKGGIARRTRSRLRRAVLVLAPKRQVRVQKRVPKIHKSNELVEKSQEEIAERDTNKMDSEKSIQSNFKVEQLDVSAGDQVADSSSTTKLAQSRLTKPSITVNPTHQPLAVIPPLPPPPPPPDPICHMSYETPSSFLKEPLHEPDHHRSELNSEEKCSVGFVPKGKLQNVGSPITQIKIYRQYVIAAAEDGDIYMFHLVTHKLERKITKHSEAITNMCLSEKDSILYTTSADGFFKKSSLLNLERVIETVYLKEPLQSIDVAWGLAFIGSRWGQISTFNVVTNKVMEQPLVSTGQSIIAIKATKEGVRKILVLGCKGNFVQMHDAGNGLLLRRVFIAEGLNIYSLLLDEGHMYCGTQKNEIYQLEFDTGNLVTKFSCGNGAVAVASYGERYLLVGCYDGFIYVLNKITGTQVGRFEGAGRMVLALSVAGDKIVTSSKDNSLEILEVPSALVNGY